MNPQQYLQEKKRIQEDILLFIDDKSNQQDNYDKIIQSIKDQNVFHNKHEFKNILYLILKISNNHKRSQFFFQRIEQIIHFMKEEIKQNFSNSEIFNIFKSSKRILLFLFKEGIIIPDSSFTDIFSSPQYQYTQRNYQKYLFPELESFLDKKISKKIKGEISHMLNIRVKSFTESEEFEEKRKVGENDSLVCQMIRNDSIEEFIIHVNKTNLSLKTKIKPSLYETNTFLLKNEITLIEYAAFFGSIQIFRYLSLNGIQPKPSIWLFAIHGRNPEMIHLLEQNNIKPPNDDFKECLNESLKCHHPEITNYILDNLLTVNNQEEKDKVFSLSTKYMNYNYFPDNLAQLKTFYYLCKYDYYELVNLFLKDENVEIEFKSILNHNIFFNPISYYFYFIKFKILFFNLIPILIHLIQEFTKQTI